MPIRASGPITARRSAVSWRISASLPRFLRNRQTARICRLPRKAAVSASSVLPGMSTITRWPGWNVLMAGLGSVGLGDFGQMARLVGVQPARARQRLDHGIEALHGSDRIEVLVAGRRQGQLGAGRAGRCGQQHARTAAAHLFGQRDQAGLGRAARREHQHRIALVDQGHRAMLDLGAGEGLGLDAAGFPMYSALI
eukprot:Opistho-1_new@38983